MMKKLGKLKLNQLSKCELDKREMNMLTDGGCCGCGCNGSSSTSANANANWDYGYANSQGDENRCACHDETYWSAHF